MILSDWERDQYIDGFNAYCVYLAIKLHFSKPDFCYADYGPMTNLKMETFIANEGRRKQFSQLARKFYHLETSVLEIYLIANFIKNPKVYVTQLLSKQGQANYDEFRKIHENFTYNFIEEVDKIIVPVCQAQKLTFMQYIKGDGSTEHTPLMKDIFQENIPLWLVVALDRVIGFRRAFNEKYKEDSFWGVVSQHIRKIDEVVPEQDVTMAKTRLKELLFSRGLV